VHWRKDALRRHWIAIIIAAILLLTLAATSLPAAAHPPEELTIIYNDRLDILTTSIKHDVKDGSAHYVDMIKVYMNDALVIEREYELQERDNYNERFSIVASEGDIIRVVLTCNIDDVGFKDEEMTVGAGITVVGDNEARLSNVLYIHATIQVIALVIAIVNIPGGMSFYRAWKNKTKPTGRKRRHIRMGETAIALWALGALGGIYIVYMTSGDYFGSIHGWLAMATLISALFMAYAASTRFRAAGFGKRMSAHMPLAMLTIVLAVSTIVCGLWTAGII
jgi:desulfoferrodoxin (superoxide reductase-like protein)